LLQGLLPAANAVLDSNIAVANSTAIVFGTIFMMETPFPWIDPLPYRSYAHSLAL
jgi:hypothetical protein